MRKILDVAAPIYTCPLTGQEYPQGTAVHFRINGDMERERFGVLMKSGQDWKIIAKIGRHGEIFPISDKGRAAAPKSIRKDQG